MKKRRPLFFVLFLVILLILGGFFLYKKKTEIIKSNSVEVEDQKSGLINLPDDSTAEDFVDESINENSTEDADFTENSYIDLIPSDCAGGCREFDESEDLKYCKEFCGLEDAKLLTTECEDLEDLDRDYCFKHQAKKEKNLSLCEVIDDENIKTVCQKQSI
jgi:hypothetical protein